MNGKKFFAIIFCALGIALAIIGGMVSARQLAIKLGYLDESGSFFSFRQKPEGIENVLLLGLDKGEMRTDTIMLAGLNHRDKEVNILSIPRDTRVRSGSQYDKINHLVGYEDGVEGTVRAIEDLTGLTVDHYVMIDTACFRDVIDILGGVEIEVPNIQNLRTGEYMGGMYYSDPVQNLKIAIPAGLQTLDGEQSEGFMRYREHYPNGDLGRIEAQQNFLHAFAEQKLKPQYITKLPSLYREFSESVETSFGVGDITSLLVTLKDLSSEQVQTHSLPGEGAAASTRYGVLSCFIPDEEETAALIEEHFTLHEIEETE